MRFVEQHDVAELYLLNHQILDVFFFDILFQQIQATSELILHAQSIHHRDNAVESWKTISSILRHKLRHRANGLCDGSRFADTAGLYHNVVEALHAQYIVQLLHKIHFQCAADTTILQSHKAVVFLPHYPIFLYKGGIDIYLAYIVHNDGKLDTAFIGQNSVEQRGLSTAQITCQQKDRCFHFHLNFHLI